MSTPTESLSVDEALDRAATLFQEQRFQEALAYYQAILKSDPAHPIANHNVGAIALQLNRPADALGYFNRALKASPDTEQYWVSTIQTLGVTGQQDLAEEMMVQAERRGLSADTLQKIYKVLRLNSRDAERKDHSDQHMDRADVPELPADALASKKLPLNKQRSLKTKLDADDHRGIQSQAADLLKRFPYDLFLRKVCSKAYYDSGDLEDSLEHLKIAAALAPDDKGIFLTLAKISLELEDMARAIGYLKRVRDIDPDDTTVLMPLATSLRKMFRFDEALALYEEMIQRKLNLFIAWNEKGLVHHQKKQYQNAEKALSHAMDHADDVQAGTVNKNLGILLMDTERYDDARKCLKKAATQNPSDIDIDLFLAKVALRQNRSDDAKHHAESVLSKNPVHIGALGILQQLDLISLRSPRFHEIKAAAEDSAYSSTERSALFYLMGHCHLKEQHSEQAFECFKSANDLVSEERPSSRLIFHQCTNLKNRFEADYFSSHPSATKSFDTSPLFISGLPRSGKSLLEKVVAQSPEVSAARELGGIRATLGKNMSEEVLLQSMNALTEEALNTDADIYLRALQAVAPETDVRYISETTPKTPFMPYYARLFPNAPVIFVQRNGWDLLAACYFKFFANGHNYAFDISSLEQRIKSEKLLIDHWMSVLPNPTLTVYYEDMVKDPQKVGREVFDFLGLEWKPAFAENVLLSEQSDAEHDPNPVNSLDFTARPEPLTAKFIGFGDQFRHYFEPFMASVKGFEEFL